MLKDLHSRAPKPNRGFASSCGCDVSCLKEPRCQVAFADTEAFSACGRLCRDATDELQIGLYRSAYWQLQWLLAVGQHRQDHLQSKSSPCAQAASLFQCRNPQVTEVLVRWLVMEADMGILGTADFQAILGQLLPFCLCVRQEVRSLAGLGPPAAVKKQAEMDREQLEKIEEKLKAPVLCASILVAIGLG